MVGPSYVPRAAAAAAAEIAPVALEANFITALRTLAPHVGVHPRLVVPSRFFDKGFVGHADAFLDPTPSVAAAVAANAQQPDWLNMGNDYAQSMDYMYRSIAGYLRKNTGRDFLLIVLGDHQPAANVSGEDAPWDTPVHIIASRAELLQPLLARGFVTGVTPARPSVGNMSELLPMVTQAMDSKAGAD